MPSTTLHSPLLSALPREALARSARQGQGPRAGFAGIGLGDDHLARGLGRPAHVPVCAAAGPGRPSRREAEGKPAGRVAPRRRPEDEEQPTKYWLSTLPESISFADLVDATKLRWRIERDYQDLKQEVGLGHYEGRGWRGFHHHATLCIAACGLLICERGAFPPSGSLAARKLQQAVVSPRGRPDPATAPSGAAREQLDRDHAAEAHRRPRQDAQPMSMLPRAAP